MECKTYIELILTTIIAISTVTSGYYIVLDIYKKHKTLSVTNIKVHNQNMGGMNEYNTNIHSYESHNATSILIKSNNSVIITLKNGTIICYSKFISWEIRKISSS